MSQPPKLKEKYQLAGCCSPREADKIIGYFSYDDFIKVHRADCSNLEKAERDRLVDLEWADIVDTEEFTPPDEYDKLEINDFAVLKHHRDFGVDYSLKVAAMLHLPKAEVFDRHKRLRSQGFLVRVEPLMIQYRKGVVDNKWIKHRNHTYYELTELGRQCLEYHDREQL